MVVIGLLAALCCCFAFAAIAIGYRRRKKPEEEEEDEQLGKNEPDAPAIELGHASSTSSGVSLNQNPMATDATKDNKLFDS